MPAMGGKYFYNGQVFDNYQDYLQATRGASMIEPAVGAPENISITPAPIPSPIEPLVNPYAVGGGFDKTAPAMPMAAPQAPAGAPQAPMGVQEPSMWDRFTSNDGLGTLGAMMLGMSQNKTLAGLGTAHLQQAHQQKALTKINNKTVEALRKKGRSDLADAVENGSLSAKDAYSLALTGGDTKVVGKSLVRFDPQTGKADILFTDAGGDDEATAAFRTLQARAEAAGLKAGTQEYAQFMIDGGTKSGFAMRMNADGSVEFAQGSGSLKPLNEMQAKATGFYGRMVLNSNVIDRLETQGTQIFDNVVKGIPFAGNFLTSPEYKQYMYAKDNWIAAQLRDESGAAIGTDEYWNADKQYFPQMGDSAEVIEQKRQRRKAAEEAMKTKSGTGVKESSETPAQKTIKIGDIVNGYRYKGGDPKQQSSWEKI